MLLTIDVGNTNAVIGLFDSPNNSEMVDHWRAATDASRTGDEWLLLVANFLSLKNISINEIRGITISSGVPRVTFNLKKMCSRLGVVPLIVKWDTNAGMPIRLDDPREIGPDRIANGVAAFEFEQRATIVVDFGTATTLDIISNQGEFLGGVILPGIQISLDALFDRAAALRRIEIVPTKSVVGTSTATALQSGATHGYAAQIDGMCAKVRHELGFGDCSIISTGGLAPIVGELSKEIQRHDPWLTLQGLRIIYLRNL